MLSQYMSYTPAAIMYHAIFIGRHSPPHHYTWGCETYPGWLPFDYRPPSNTCANTSDFDLVTPQIGYPAFSVKFIRRKDILPDGYVDERTFRRMDILANGFNALTWILLYSQITNNTFLKWNNYLFEIKSNK